MRNLTQFLKVLHLSPFPSRLAACAVLVCTLLGAPAGAVDLYVDQAATGANTGTSWADAFLTLEAGLAAAVSGDVIHIADGVYAPQGSLPRSGRRGPQRGVRRDHDAGRRRPPSCPCGRGHRCEVAHVADCTIAGGAANGFAGTSDARGGGAYIKSFRVTFRAASSRKIRPGTTGARSTCRGATPCSSTVGF